jgi:branched-chain amino acid transport system permease protein
MTKVDLPLADTVYFQDRQATLATQRPRSRGPRPRLAPVVAPGVALIVTLAVGISGGPYILTLATSIAVLGLVAVSQEWLMGRCGLVSLGGAAFMGIGAYTTTWLSAHGVTQLPILLVASAATGTIVGAAVGGVGLRFKGLYLLLATAALQFIAAYVFQKIQGENPLVLGNVSLGPLNASDPRTMFWIDAVVCLAVAAALSSLLGKEPGRVWRAMREHPVAASSFGIPVRSWRIAAFTGSSAIAAFAGCLYALFLGSSDYSDFSLALSLSLVVMVYLGGVNTVYGPILGAALIVILPHWLGDIAGIAGASNQWFKTNEQQLAVLVEWILLLAVLLSGGTGIAGVIRRAGRRLAPGGAKS